MSKRLIFTGILVIGIIVTVAAMMTNGGKETASSANIAQEGKGLEWLNYDTGLKKGLEEKKPIMVTFYADWCSYCRKMDSDTLTNTSIIRYLTGNFVIIKVNTDKERELSSKYGVMGLPTTWFLKYNGTPIGPLSGYTPPDKFIKVLRYIREEHYKSISLKEFLEKV